MFLGIETSTQIGSLWQRNDGEHGGMRVFDFDHAIVRAPGRSVVTGLRSDVNAVPDLEEILHEHAAYVAELQAGGLEVEVLPSLEAFPDSMFVEDPALVFPEGAILLRPGAPSRLGESAQIRPVLARHFDILLELDGGGYADGGDVLVTPEMVFVGLSGRTDLAGARSLVARLDELGRKARIAETPPGVLHFKTAVSLLDEETLLATRAMADSQTVKGFRTLAVPEGEEAAANALRVNDSVLVGAHFPRTIGMIQKAGFSVVPLRVREVGKLDAGLSCMSLRWHKRA
jgi:dimethylargininase